jgi:sulfate/thiosulfate transport system substrate-binding protein
MVFAKHGLRSPDPQVALATEEQYPPVEDLFTIEYFGGWGEVTDFFFGIGGIYDQVIIEWQGQ